MKYSDLSTRMKEYEAVTKYKLLRRGYTIIRIDGKAFHTYTKGLERPFDWGLIDDMDETAAYLCKKIQGAVCAFVQSDEISILVTDFEKPETSAWFDNSLQKMCSISASMTTAKFNQLRMLRKSQEERDHSLSSIAESAWDNDNLSSQMISDFKLAMFDSRVFQLPTTMEVINYMVWRQQDTVKNSISSVAQSMFSHKELHGKNGSDKQEMMFQKDGTNWNDFEPKVKRGRMIIKEIYEKIPEVFRSRWISIPPPTFTKDREFLLNLIPNKEMTPTRFIPKDLSDEEKMKFISELKKINEKIYSR
jgi:tRNA(His) 5'-end guanylyltransferase